MPRKTEITLSAGRIVKICDRIRSYDKSFSWSDCAALLGIADSTLGTLRKNAQYYGNAAAGSRKRR